LEGDKDDLIDLSKIFTSPEFSINEIDGNFYLFSDSFNSIEDSGLVEEKGKEFLVIINAGVKLTSNYLREIKTAGVESLNSDGGVKKRFVHLDAEVRNRAKVELQITKADGTVIEDNPFEPLVKWRQLAQEDPLVAKAFYLISHDFNTWFSLYKLLEIMEEDGFAPLMRDGKYKKEANRFSQTAQSYAALGLHARHIKSTFKAPPDPMSLDEAKSFIRMLVNEWLMTK